MHYWILGFFLGVCSLNICSYLPKWYLAGVFFLPFLYLIDFKQNIFCMFSYFTGYKNKHIGRRDGFLRIVCEKCLLALIVFGFCWGFAWALIYAHSILVWNLPAELEGKTIAVTGVISSIPESNSIQTNFTFDTSTFQQQKQKTKLHLAWFGEHPALIVGASWQLQVRLKRPHGTLNPGGFDYEKYLLQHHIRATGYVVPKSANNFLADHWYSFPIAKLRQKVEHRIRYYLLHSPLTGVVSTLVIGSESHITQEQWKLLRATGTSYLMAISGLHIGLVGAIVFWLVDFLWRRSKRLPLVLPAKSAAALAGFIGALFYSLISGFSIPTQRALIMLSIFLAMQFLRRNMPTWNSLIVALFVVLLFDPLAVLSIGFWLSFVAVALIIYVTAGHGKDAAGSKIVLVIKRYWQLQLAITLGLMPLTLLLFQQVSWMTIIANIIALPGVCLIVVPLALFGSVLLIVPGFIGGWILWLSAKIMQLIWFWLEFCARCSHLTWQHAIYNWWIFAAATLGVVILLAPKAFPGKALGVVWCLPLVFWQPAAPQLNSVWFTLLDVGQGLASIIRTQHHTIIYDTGLKTLSGDSGANIVVPYLLNSGVDNVAMLIISHGDNDHAGGAASVLAELPVANIYSSVPWQIAPGRAKNCSAGQSWHWDGVDFEFLAPGKNINFQGNNASCVLQVSAGNKTILLTGDIEKDAEKELLTKKLLSANILVAPHHGSATSSTKDFIAAIQPEYVLFPIGYRNRFRFPAKSVVKRYQALNAKLLYTPTSGAISFKTEPNSVILTPEFYREQNKHYWND